MNHAIELWEILPEDKTIDKSEVLHMIEDTLSELEIYLERYPEDDIARMQHKQFSQKLEALADESLPGLCNSLTCLDSLSYQQNVNDRFFGV
ncbi:hypothetical protein [Paenibacillus nasutitermitis]|uniref:Uncharacterized protein n=1 Tax=Paenibacillus nasutitermitis TaxID=1652958 RepID=A0A917DU65_9BACL|nr:hypothetical protein [Paenibacillus nasutitermitis]GGD67095.1 hypothetical protein GCM10010911_26090 [Paenibacillus nasutitermitis]